ncbi:MAG: glycosyltransferase family 2 protein [Paludibacteraceae bacterium]|nr:glycosyltransferase family 2 protein [Paludibacteraceae bacterium]
MNNPKISIIIPIYRAEKYIKRCIDSILSQSLTDFEVLLIDDGSPDKSGEICDEYARIDNRIRVFHKRNEGVSSARNLGIENATGDFTIHVDSDDWVESDMLKELYLKAMESNADIVFCDYFLHQFGQVNYRTQCPTSEDNQQILCELFSKLNGCCWNKLIKRELYSEYKVIFPTEISFCEDLYVIASFLKNKIKVSYCNKAFYHYIKNENPSSLSSVTNGSFEKDKLMFDMFVNLLKGLPAEKVFKRVFSMRIALRNFWRNKDSSSQFAKHCFPLLRYINPLDDLKGYMLVMPSSIGLYSIIRSMYNVKHSIKCPNQ